MYGTVYMMYITQNYKLANSMYIDWNIGTTSILKKINISTRATKCLEIIGTVNNLFYPDYIQPIYIWH